MIIFKSVMDSDQMHWNEINSKSYFEYTIREENWVGRTMLLSILYNSLHTTNWQTELK